MNLSDGYEEMLQIFPESFSTSEVITVAIARGLEKLLAEHYGEGIILRYRSHRSSCDGRVDSYIAVYHTEVPMNVFDLHAWESGGVNTVLEHLKHYSDEFYTCESCDANSTVGAYIRFTGGVPVSDLCEKLIGVVNVYIGYNEKLSEEKSNL